MKARVIETGEIIEVKSLYSPIYSRLDCNGKIIEEYDEDELEFPTSPKMVSLDKICEWVKEHINEYHNPKCIADLLLINDLRKEFE
jgi:hypothetical protein